jgi:ferrous iron transport protein B
VHISKQPVIALVGNPNNGKTSLFNILTGLQQKVGNYSGVTVDKKTGSCKLPNNSHATIVDLPGTYSLYPKSGDEYVTYDVLLDANNELKPDLIIILADATNLKRNLLFCSQIIDLKTPVLIALTMMDIAQKKGIRISTTELSRQVGVPVVPINPRKDRGIAELLKQAQLILQHPSGYIGHETIDNHSLAPSLIQGVQKIFPSATPYASLHLAADVDAVHFFNTQQKLAIQKLVIETGFNKNKIQAKETLQRYARIKQYMLTSVVENDPLQKEIRTERIDKILLHPIFGNVILLVVLFLLFQSVYWLASFPMQWIDGGFSTFVTWLNSLLPSTWLTNLFINGVMAGLGGIIIFIPQIMILFGLICLLEDSGYMSRISFLTDRLMRSVGLNGKAVVPLISGVACAVPAIMSARTIENRKERLITVLITPLMSCSARLPVYTILIALVIPPTKYLGFISLQGLVMLGLYMLGFISALVISKILSYIIKAKGKSIFLMELPVYRAPRLKNILLTMIQKAKVFVLDAGKIIMLISIVLWWLSNNGPKSNMQKIETQFANATTKQETLQKSTALLEASYAGMLGKFIEPAIQPIGFDWKIGIALLASFAAREVFVGTMATIYSVDAEDTKPLMQKMEQATNSNGKKTYTLATGLSLLMFYVFAMQCMSTLAIVKKETRSWKIPAIQFLYMGALAYLSSLLVYNLFS